MTFLAKRTVDDCDLDALFAPVVSIPEPSTEQLAAANAVEEWAKPKEKKKRRPSGISEKTMIEARSEAARYMKSGDWSEAEPRHFVALFEILFLKVYQTEPSHSPKERIFIAAAIAKRVENDFGGDPGKCADYLRWTWARESAREEWRRQNNTGGGSLGWRLLFISGAVLTDYRVALAREGKKIG